MKLSYLGLVGLLLAAAQPGFAQLLNPPAPVLIADETTDPTSLLLSWRGQSGKFYTVESATALSMATLWQKTPGLYLRGTNSDLSFATFLPTSADKLFLRVTEIDPSTPQDSNGDNLDDRWQRLYFGSLTATGSGRNDDPDGDLITNLQEFKDGTDPTDRLSGNQPNLVFTVVEGNNQIYRPGMYMPDPIVIKVTLNTENGAPQDREKVIITAPTGAGLYSTTLNDTNPQRTLTLTTNAQGTVTFYWKAP